MGQDGNIVQFKIKKHTALKKLMSTYCERAGLALQVAFYAFLDSFTVRMYQFCIFMFRKMTRHDQWRFHHQTIRFSFDGTRINESDTPKGLDMEVGNITLRSWERYLNSHSKFKLNFLQQISGRRHHWGLPAAVWWRLGWKGRWSLASYPFLYFNLTFVWYPQVFSRNPSSPPADNCDHENILKVTLNSSLSDHLGNSAF